MTTSKTNSLPWFCEKYGKEIGTLKYRLRGEKIRNSKKEPVWTKFIRYPGIDAIIKDVEVTDVIKNDVDLFFQDRYWKKHRKLSVMIANWIKLGIGDWENRYLKLLEIGISSNTAAAYLLRYGDDVGKELHHQTSLKKIKHFKNRQSYWITQGFDENEAKIKVSEVQRQLNQKAVLAQKNDSSWKMKHPGFKEYWIKNGMTELAASGMISMLQKRDQSYFVAKYGEEDGLFRFSESKKRRRTTWESKDKVVHAISTTPTSFNISGQEMLAIKSFILANNINERHCKFGSPRDQFWQVIKDTGYRRYDLAVFEDESHQKLKLVFEYHGPGHINFSDFSEIIRHNKITINDRELMHLGTYGEAYDNDQAKRQHIVNNYPDVLYIVMWTDDLIKRRFLIDELQQRRV